MENNTYQSKNQIEIEIDKNTGEFLQRRTTRVIEQIDEYVDVKLPKKHRFNNGNFITLFQDAMTEIAINGNLTKGELQLLFYLIGQANPFGAVNLTLNDLVEDLKENKGNLVRAIKGLVERKIILKKTENGARIKGKLNYYELSLSYDRLNYNLAWKGKVKDYKNVQEKDPEILKEKPKSIGLFNGLGSIEEGFSEQKKIKGVQILD